MPTITEAPHLDKVFDARDPDSLSLGIERLDSFGHVALSHVFPPQLLDRAADQGQLDEHFPIGRAWRNQDGYEVAVRTGLQLPGDDEGLGAIRGAMSKQVADLGRRFTPDPTHTKHFDRLAILPAGHSSRLEQVLDSQGPTMAITTLRGEGLLAIDHPDSGRAHHPLKPGVVSLIHGHDLRFRESAHPRLFGSWLGYFVTMQVPDKPF